MSVIVLTTHSMEEADLLCDDIYILAEGRLAAQGTPLQLKGGVRDSWLRDDLCSSIKRWPAFAPSAASYDCCLSVVSLAAQYGVGYTLTVVLKAPAAPPMQLLGSLNSSSASMASDSSAATADLVRPSARSGSSTSINQYHLPAQASTAAAAVLRLITSYVPSAKLLSDSGHEVAIKLPQEQTSAFSAMLHQLEASAADLGVASYGLSVTTLEEVFLAIADQAVAVRPQTVRASSKMAQHSSRTTDDTHTAPVCAVQQKVEQPPEQQTQQQTLQPPPEQQQQELPRSPAAHAEVVRLTGLSLLGLQFKALFIKRVLCAR
jgi:hypothetical protein